MSANDHLLPSTSESMQLCAQLRRRTGALFVICVRPADVAYSVDPRVAPKDFGESLEAEIPHMVEDLARSRTARKG